MLQRILHGASVGLALPPAKFSTVILDDQTITHGLKLLSRHKQATIHEIRAVHSRFACLCTRSGAPRLWHMQ